MKTRTVSVTQVRPYAGPDNNQPYYDIQRMAVVEQLSTNSTKSDILAAIRALENGTRTRPALVPTELCYHLPGWDGREQVMEMAKKKGVGAEQVTEGVVLGNVSWSEWEVCHFQGVQ